MFDQARKGSDLPSSFEFWNTEYLLDYFNAQGFEFGNWLNQKDRYEYLVGCAISLLDLSKIVNLEPRQIGLGGHLTFAFGARGQSAALAHFEPHSWAINITRYRDSDKRLKAYKYIESGGAGSLGHEWAHALDQYLYFHHDQEFRRVHMLSDILPLFMVPISGTDRFKMQSRPKGKAARVMLDLMVKICYRKMKGGDYEYSDFYGRIVEMVEEKGNGVGEYWSRPHEILARSFEVFLFEEGKRKRISNPFLKKTKYTSVMYPTKEDYLNWRREMKALFSFASSKVRVTDHYVPELASS